MKRRAKPGTETAVLSYNPYFFCSGCKTARSSFAPTYFRSGRCHDICLRHCSCFALLHTRSAQLYMKRLCTGFRGRNGVPHRKIRDTLQLYFRQLQRTVRLSVWSVLYSDDCHHAVYRGFTWYSGIRIFKEQLLMHLLPAVSFSALCSRMKSCLLRLQRRF